MNIRIKKLYFKIDLILVIIVLLYIFSKVIREYLYYYIGCYLFIMFHEFSHILVARMFNYNCNKIEFTICGMSANININRNKKRNILIYLAGPISNLIFAYLFYDNEFIYTINIVIAIINLLPVYPLDGYRIIKELNIYNKWLDYVIYSLLIFLSMYTKNVSIIIFLVYILGLKATYIKNYKYNSK